MECWSIGALVASERLNYLDHLQKSWCDPKGSRGQGFKDSSEIIYNFSKF